MIPSAAFTEAAFKTARRPVDKSWAWDHLSECHCRAATTAPFLRASVVLSATHGAPVTRRASQPRPMTSDMEHASATFVRQPRTHALGRRARDTDSDAASDRLRCDSGQAYAPTHLVPPGLWPPFPCLSVRAPAGPLAGAREGPGEPPMPLSGASVALRWDELAAGGLCYVTLYEIRISNDPCMKTMLPGASP